MRLMKKVHSVYCAEVNIWTDEFLDSLGQGRSIGEACSDADERVVQVWPYDYTTIGDDRLVRGNTNKVFG